MILPDHQQRRIVPVFDKRRGVESGVSGKIKFIIFFFRKKILVLLFSEKEQARLRDFQELCRKYYGKELADKKAERRLNDLLAMLAALRRGADRWNSKSLPVPPRPNTPNGNLIELDKLPFLDELP